MSLEIFHVLTDRPEYKDNPNRLKITREAFYLYEKRQHINAFMSSSKVGQNIIMLKPLCDNVSFSSHSAI